ncbi:MAG: hypothetical protein IPM30_07350 [Burkholderiales bacterium]|jgi:NAD(P)-dependent dehydrogenase (short-subunit alcohol dehydrogenase family)|nr:hypothetical protein [Burkholderiales bacterium]
MRLEEMVAIVTGAEQGIGLATARRFAAGEAGCTGGAVIEAAGGPTV